MKGIKKGVVTALSWWAFLHACLLALSVVMFEIGVLSSFGRLETFMQDYFLFAVSPAIWVVLYIQTGSARILPWNQ